MAIGLDHQTAQGSVRLTLGSDNTAQDVDYTVEAVREITERLRKISPVYKK
jgi:cysteine desulfurase